MRAIANQKATLQKESSNDHSNVDQSSYEAEQKVKNGLSFRSVSNGSNGSDGNGDDSSTPSFGIQNFSKISILPPSISPIQTKLKINEPGDRYEQEADKVAEQVMRMPEQTVQRKCSKCGKEEDIKSNPGTSIQRKCAKCEHEEQMLQTKAKGHRNNIATSSLTSQIQNTKGGGQAMDANTRSFMEPRFGMDFSKVKIHADNRAVKMNNEINSKAFTVGSNIYFNQNEYKPSSSSGRALLAHELVHVVQQQSVPQVSTYSYNTFSQASEEYGTSRETIADTSLKVNNHSQSAVMRRLAVERPADLIPNPQGTGLVQTNAATIQEYLRQMSPEGDLTVDGTSGEVSSGDEEFCTPRGFWNRLGRGMGSGFLRGAEIGAYFLGVGAIPGAIIGSIVGGIAGAAGPDSEAEESSTPTASSCICDFINSENNWTIRIDDSDTPLTGDTFVRVNSPNSSRIWGAATESGARLNIPHWLTLAHELCGHAWLDLKGMREGAEEGERHHRTVERENLIRAEHGIEARGFRLRDPYCGESFSRDRNSPEGSVEWQRLYDERNRQAIVRDNMPMDPNRTMLDECQANREQYLGADVARRYRVDQRIPE